MKPKKFYLKIALTLLLLSLFTPHNTWALENQFQLNGFWLHQYKKVLPATFGKPLQTGETVSTTREAYPLPNKAYMIFEFLKQKPHWIYSIQITGEKTEMLPFAGLILGDDKTKVIKILGKPDKIKKVKNMDIDLYEYEAKNFSIEINNKGQLYSIRIYGYNDLFKTFDKDSSYWRTFKETVLKKDFKSLSTFFRPDVEIYINGAILCIDKPVHRFFSEPSGKFYNAIFSETSGVYKELQDSEAESEIRLVPKFGVGIVYKFYTGKIVEEIVFFPYAGKYRIYEIKFKSS